MHLHSNLDSVIKVLAFFLAEFARRLSLQRPSGAAIFLIFQSKTREASRRLVMSSVATLLVQRQRKMTNKSERMAVFSPAFQG